MIVLVLLALADWRSLVEGRKDVRVVFAGQSIKGLKAGAEVQFKGVTVGKVRQVDLDYRTPENIQVVIEVPRAWTSTPTPPCPSPPQPWAGRPGSRSTTSASLADSSSPPAARSSCPPPAT